MTEPEIPDEEAPADAENGDEFPHDDLPTEAEQADALEQTRAVPVEDDDYRD